MFLSGINISRKERGEQLFKSGKPRLATVKHSGLSTAARGWGRGGVAKQVGQKTQKPKS